jgi:triosephosphate isomerase
VRLVVANWKMNKVAAEARAFRDAFAGETATISGIEIAIAPAFPFFADAADPAGRWSLCGQNCSSERSGAFTGEVAAAMLADAGCRYVILGHSERRKYFGETAGLLAIKLDRAREAGLVPIFCIGETLEEREAGSTEAVLRRQLDALAEDPPEKPLVVAYEPVWAIGTGRNATPGQASEAAARIRGLLSGRKQLRILYGGSVTAENAGLLAGSGEIGGFLVGGASLSPRDMAAICSASRLTPGSEKR